MKKYLSLLLALCLTLSLAACGSKADTSANAADGSQTQDNAPTEAPAGEPVEVDRVRCRLYDGDHEPAQRNVRAE
ncbi:MAG: hypothetical protein V8R21_00610 [Dysosmobacter sp.]